MRPWRIGTSSGSRPIFASSIKSTVSRLLGGASQVACELRGHFSRSFFPFARSSASVARGTIELLAATRFEEWPMVPLLLAAVISRFDNKLGNDPEGFRSGGRSAGEHKGTARRKQGRKRNDPERRELAWRDFAHLLSSS